MRILAVVLLGLGLVGCGSDGDDKVNVVDGTAEQCASLFQIIDDFDQNRDNITEAEGMAMCRDVQRKYSGIRCERQLQLEDGSTEVELVVIDGEFCKK